jgi:nitroreductase
MATSSADPWELRETDYPTRGSRNEKLRFLVRYAILAPSNRNSQPWRFKVGRGRISLHADISRWQRIADPHCRELRISLGCALENLLIALEHFGFGYHVTYCPVTADSSIAAQIAIVDECVTSPLHPASMFKAIVRRRTNHGRYQDRAVTATVLRKLMDCNADDDLALLLTHDAETKQLVDKLMLWSDALTLSNPEYREELAASIGGGNFGGPWLLSVAQEFAVAHLGVRGTVARGTPKALKSSPVFGLISGVSAGEEVQIRAGQLLERVYLAATSRGLCLQPVSQLLEVTKVKTQFAKLFRAGGVPLLPFRLGYADSPGRPTPRRPLEDVLRATH